MVLLSLLFENYLIKSSIEQLSVCASALIIEGFILLADYTSGNICFPEYIYFIIFPCIIGSIFLIFLFSLIFLKIIEVDDKEIKAVRFNKVLWAIKKEDIENCLYYRFKWWHLFIPVGNFASGDLMFKLKNGKTSEHYCCFSRRQVQKIIKAYDYHVVFD